MDMHHEREGHRGFAYLAGVLQNFPVSTILNQFVPAHYSQQDNLQFPSVSSTVFGELDCARRTTLIILTDFPHY